MNRDAIEGLIEYSAKRDDMLYEAVSLLTAYAGGQILDNREVYSLVIRFGVIAREGVSIEKYFKAVMKNKP